MEWASMYPPCPSCPSTKTWYLPANTKDCFETSYTRHSIHHLPSYLLQSPTNHRLWSHCTPHHLPSQIVDMLNSLLYPLPLHKKPTEDIWQEREALHHTWMDQMDSPSPIKLGDFPHLASHPISAPNRHNDLNMPQKPADFARLCLQDTFWHTTELTLIWAKTPFCDLKIMWNSMKLYTLESFYSILCDVTHDRL